MRASCSFAPDESCIRDDGHLYAESGILSIEGDELLMFVKVKEYQDYEDGKIKSVYIFQFLHGDREAWLPINAQTDATIEDVLNFLGMFVEIL